MAEQNGEEKAQVFDEDVGFETKVAENWINKQRTFIGISRGVKKNEKQLAKNFMKMLCHVKTDSKIEKKDSVEQVREVCRVKNCVNFIYFEQRRDQLFAWLGKSPAGPSVKLLIGDVLTAESQKFLGNSLKGSRPLFSFGSAFSGRPELALLKNLLVDALNIPNHHPGAQPFFDRVFSFNEHAGRVHFRNYQVSNAGARVKDIELVEIGPRFNLQIIRVFEGFLSGRVLFSNPEYIPGRAKKRTQETALRKKIEKKQERKDVRQEKIQRLVNNKERDLMDEFYE